MTGRSTARAIASALLAAFALSWSFLAAAQVPVPPLTGHIIDQTRTLTAEQKASLEQTLTAFEARKGSQLAVLMLPSTAPEAIEQYALRVAEQWQLGRKKVDDGAILIVAKDDRALRIEVGYGLEGALNDATSKRIISEIITPRFQQQDFYGGISAGVGQIISVIGGEPLPEPSGSAAAVQGAVPPGTGARSLCATARLGHRAQQRLADRAVEIVADRGLHSRVGAREWENICRRMETAFKQGNYESGGSAASNR